MAQQIFRVDGIVMALNYGLNRVRFPSPVKSGDKVRLTTELSDYKDIAGGIQAVYKHTIQVEGQEKPSCVAESVVRLLETIPGA